MEKGVNRTTLLQRPTTRVVLFQIISCPAAINKRNKITT